MTKSLSSSDPWPPDFPSTDLTINEDNLIHQALSVLEQRVFQIVIGKGEPYSFAEAGRP